ncbi:hypothetical protein DTO207G8_2924 [Paecilomyces variotii]|nr:hypothetical protein DTO207G8_2924 [Paecilomyces variotii]
MGLESAPTDAPASIPLSEAEKAKGKYSVATLRQILERFNDDGFLVLEDVVDVAHVEKINKYMQDDTDNVLREVYGSKAYFNHGVRSNILHCAPLKPEYIFEDVYMNPFVIQVMNAYLGARPRWNFITGNNALGNTKGLRQPVHKDIRWSGHPTAPFYAIANVPLTDFSPENGSTEFWLGTHKITTTADQQTTPEGAMTCNVKIEKLEERRKVRPPVQVHAKKGSITLRDLRLWHAGMPNPSDEHRIMMALGYQARWYPNYTQRLKLPESMMNFFHHDDIEIMANFVSDEEVQANQHRDNFHFSASV